MKEPTYHIYLDCHERVLLLHSLVWSLQMDCSGKADIRTDELIYKAAGAPAKKMKIEYV